MSRATEVYSREFDSVFFKLPLGARELAEGKIADLGFNLSRFPHHRLQGRSEYRLRAGAYRVIYEFDREKNVLYLSNWSSPLGVPTVTDLRRRTKRR